MPFSTVEFVATAATGGLLGGFVQQFVQWRMSLTQRAAEDQRRAQDRQHTVEDARARRREERYVPLLTELSRFDRELESVATWIRLYVTWRERGEARTGDEERMGVLERASANRAAQLGAESWQRAGEAQEEVQRAFHAAYAVASVAARECGQRLIERPMGFRFDRLTAPESEFLILPANLDVSEARYGTLREFGEQAKEDVSHMRALIADLDRQLRDDLTLD